jgi:hypothetical protein
MPGLAWINRVAALGKDHCHMKLPPFQGALWAAVAAYKDGAPLRLERGVDDAPGGGRKGSRSGTSPI